MEQFVKDDSIVREIWGKSDTVLFIFAGASAEFALNKAVDLLYFTGKLPADPLGRLFSTVGYARSIIFSDTAEALKTIDRITAIHAAVETKRGETIPDWAYRDVLFLLIDYSIRAYELLERRLTPNQKAEVFDVFYRVGDRMGIPSLPSLMSEYEVMRLKHLQENMRYSHYTLDLFSQYKKHLGLFRYRILLESQALVVPDTVSQLLGFGRISLFRPLITAYKLARTFKTDKLIKLLILPGKYRSQVEAIDMKPVGAKCPFSFRS